MMPTITHQVQPMYQAASCTNIR